MHRRLPGTSDRVSPLCCCAVVRCAVPDAAPTAAAGEYGGHQGAEGDEQHMDDDGMYSDAGPEDEDFGGDDGDVAVDDLEEEVEEDYNITEV